MLNGISNTFLMSAKVLMGRLVVSLAKVRTGDPMQSRPIQQPQHYSLKGVKIGDLAVGTKYQQTTGPYSKQFPNGPNKLDVCPQHAFPAQWVKPGAYLGVEQAPESFLLSRKHKTRLEKPARDKHSNLLSANKIKSCEYVHRLPPNQETRHISS